MEAPVLRVNAGVRPAGKDQLVLWMWTSALRVSTAARMSASTRLEAIVVAVRTATASLRTVLRVSVMRTCAYPSVKTEENAGVGSVVVQRSGKGERARLMWMNARRLEMTGGVRAKVSASIDQVDLSADVRLGTCGTLAAGAVNVTGARA